VTINERVIQLTKGWSRYVLYVNAIAYPKRYPTRIFHTQNPRNVCMYSFKKSL